MSDIITIPFDAGTDVDYYKNSSAYIKDFDGYLHLKESYNNLLFHFKLDENPIDFSANAVKDSGTEASHPGTVYSSDANHLLSQAGASGKYGFHYYFNYNYGSYVNRIQVPTINSLPNNGYFAFSAWVNISNNTGVNVLASQAGSAVNFPWSIYWYAGDHEIHLATQDASNNFHYYTLGSMTTTDLHHVAVNINNSTHQVDCWIDGNKTTVVNIIDIKSTTNPFTIGNHYNHYNDTTDRHWRGNIDDFKLWQGNLSDAQVAALYNSPNPYAHTLTANVPFTTYAFAYTKTNFNTYGDIVSVDSFDTVTGPEHNGSFLFNIAKRDPSTYYEWFYWDGSAWVTSDNYKDYTQANTLAEVQANLATMPVVGGDEFYVKVWLVTDGDTYPELDELNIGVTAAFPATRATSFKYSVAIEDLKAPAFQFEAAVPEEVNKGFKLTVNEEAITNPGFKFKAVFENILNPAFKFILNRIKKPAFKFFVEEATTADIGYKFNIPNSAGSGGYGFVFNAVHELMNSAGFKFRTIVETLSDKGLKFRVVVVDIAKKGFKFVVPAPKVVARGFKFLVDVVQNSPIAFKFAVSANAIKEAGFKFVVSSAALANKGFKFLVSLPSEVAKGFKFFILKQAVNPIGLKFRVAGRKIVAFKYRIVGALKNYRAEFRFLIASPKTENRGFKFKINRSRIVAFKFFVDGVYKYIDKLHAAAVEWLGTKTKKQ